MPTSPDAVSPVQLSFADMPMVPQPEAMQENPNTSFGRVVMPYFFKIDPGTYNDVPTEMVQEVAPARLAATLMPGGRKGRYAIDGVALNPNDYETIPRDVRSLARVASNRAEAAASIGGLDEQNRLGEKTRGAALQLKFDAMKKRVPIILANETRLEIMRGAANNPGKEYIPRQELYDLAWMTWKGDFADMLRIVGRERRWTSSDLELASKALDIRLFLSRRDRISNWKDMIGLGLKHDSAVLGLYGSRMDGIKYQLGRIARNVTGPA